jgi:tRNA-2-methylthio-N6-dimethylallyladenosine synthase
MTMRLLKVVRFDGIFAFKYSKRPGTAALNLSGHLSDDTKEKRLSQVLSLQKEISEHKNQEHIGARKEILIDGYSKRGGMLTGRTRGNRVVNIAADASLIGCLATVRIIGAGANSLTGQICE